jgi:hypothetical protein
VPSPINAIIGAFAIGSAIQRLIDIGEVTCALLTRRRNREVASQRRKALFAWAATALAFPVAWSVPVLAALGHSAPRWVDLIVTALIVSAGAEWFNAFVKFVTYAKEQKQEEKEAARAERKLTETVADSVSPAACPS